MVGTTLAEIREHIESLASDDGTYSVRCGRTGERPIPVSGRRFESRSVAERAVYAAEQYRAALRRYDPQLPYYDLIVSQVGKSDTLSGKKTGESTRAESHVEPGLYTQSAHSPLVEFCHQIAAAVFETLCDSGYRAVETAVMDVYFELAETVQNPNNLCLCLLESMAAELDRRLTPTEQVDVFTETATRLSPSDSAGDSVSAALKTLEERDLLSAYTCSPASVDGDDETRAVDVRIAGYVLSPKDGRLPVLPLVLGVYCHRPERPLSSLHVADAGEGWRLTFVLSNDSEPTGLASVAIESGV